jgi:hypothetical protein
MTNTSSCPHAVPISILSSALVAMGPRQAMGASPCRVVPVTFVFRGLEGRRQWVAALLGWA